MILGMSLIKVRIVFLTVAFFHLAVTAVVTLSIDTRGDEDQRIRDYFYVRWKLLTCWFNILTIMTTASLVPYLPLLASEVAVLLMLGTPLIMSPGTAHRQMVTLVYLPIRLYTDIKSQAQDEDNEKFLNKLNHITDVLMTGILMPVTVYGDLTFWTVYLTDPTILAPVRIFDYLPYWSQHSLHTVSFAVIVMDLLLTPRRTPKSLKPRLLLLTAFVLGYSSVLYICLWRGEIVYSVLEQASTTLLTALPLISLAICFILFYTQWIAIDYFWGNKLNTEETKIYIHEIEKKEKEN